MSRELEIHVLAGAEGWSLVCGETREKFEQI